MALEDILRAGREGLSVEFKRSMSWNDNATKAKVIRTALAMANVRDGGVLAFGLDEVQGQPLCQLVGMSQEHYDSFTQYGVTRTVNTHATPHLDLSVEHVTIDGLRFVAVVIRQFTDYPVICSQDFVGENNRPAVIRGRLYCRSRRTPESTEIQTPEDMRDVIELASARALERYFKMRDIERQFEGPTPRERFERQIGEL